jgi:hypothetical protein
MSTSLLLEAIGFVCLSGSVHPVRGSQSVGHLLGVLTGGARRVPFARTHVAGRTQNNCPTIGIRLSAAHTHEYSRRHAHAPNETAPENSAIAPHASRMSSSISACAAPRLRNSLPGPIVRVPVPPTAVSVRPPIAMQTIKNRTWATANRPTARTPQAAGGPGGAGSRMSASLGDIVIIIGSARPKSSMSGVAAPRAHWPDGRRDIDEEGYA